MITLLLCILALPFVALFCLWFSARVVSNPWKSPMEALVRLLYWLALRLQALAEAVDSGLVCYRDACTRPISPHCEMHRQIREQAALNQHAESAAIARLRTV